MENEFIAQYTTSYQITQDEWKASERTLKVTEDTTIGEILSWFRQNEKKSPLEVRLIQIQDAKS